MISTWSSTLRREMFCRNSLRRAATSGARCGHDQRQFFNSCKRCVYEDTIPNLRIGRDTRLIFQGFTDRKLLRFISEDDIGRQATANAQQSLEYGTRIVGGVTPGRTGEHLGLPVLPSVRVAQEQLRPDATGIYVAAQHASKAIEEAIDAEIPLIIAVAEHIPLHEMLKIHSMLQTQSKSRLVGANCPGIISPVGRCRIGFQPLPCFSAGKVGIVAKSGTLSYEAVASTTRAGLGQSLVIGMGGDIVAGTSLVDALKIFEHDDDTEGILLIGEVGGRAEEDAADWVREYRRRIEYPKPIAALVAGLHAVPGRVMGHAGAFASPGEADARTKIQTLQEAGVHIVSHPAKFGGAMKQLMSDVSGSGRKPTPSVPGKSQQRGLHTVALRRPTGIETPALQQRISAPCPRRTLYVSPQQAFRMLQDRSIPTSDTPTASSMLLAISIDRSALAPCIMASPAQSTETGLYHGARRFPFDYRATQRDLSLPQTSEIANHMELDPDSSRHLPSLIKGLLSIFYNGEAFSIETRLSVREGRLVVQAAKLGFDDAAFRSAGRREEIHKLRNVHEEDPAELEAEKYGIVYTKLAGDGNIGTLVNGAGLAMNTNDALATHGGRSANFLDTGGKATSETVKHSFELIVRDPRVRVVLVNIFGGLTLCDMIAQGILLAFRELEMTVPVVVRLRGTNEEAGQQIIAESGLPLHAFDDFDEAARKAIALASSRS